MVFEEIYQTIRYKHSLHSSETLIVGIGGNTGSGKSTFAKEFSEFLKFTKNIESIRWGNDFYQAPRSQKSKKRKELVEKGEDRKDNWWKIVGEEIYYNTYNRNLMEEHLIKFKSRQDILPVKLYNEDSGEWDIDRNYTFNNSNEPFWVLHDGVYLFDPQVRKHLDSIILLTTGEEKIISDPNLGEVSQERKVRFERVSKRALKRGHKVDYYQGFLPLDIQTTRHLRDAMEKEKDLILVDNRSKDRRVI